MSEPVWLTDALEKRRTMVEAKPQPRILATNQLTGPVFRQLVEALSDAGVGVDLLAGFVEIPTGHTPRFRWLRAARLDRSTPLRRVVSWTRFAIGALGAMVRYRRRPAFLVTNPPLVPWLAGLIRPLIGFRYALLVYDVYPDALVSADMIHPGGLLHRFLKRLSANALHRAECVFALSPQMRQALLDHLRPGETVDIHVIPNWADTDFITPRAKADNPFAVEHDLTDKFVVMYSGAFSSSHDLLGILDAAQHLTDLPDVQFVLIGEGPQERAIRDRMSKLGSGNVLLLPWQAVDTVPYSLAAADCHLVSIDAGRAGTIVPSKTYSALAAGAAIIAISPQDTEVVSIVEEEQCGVRVPPRRPEALAAAIRGLRDDPQRLAQYKANARTAAVERYNPSVCTAQYLEILRPILHMAGPTSPGDPT